MSASTASHSSLTESFTPRALAYTLTRESPIRSAAPYKQFVSDTGLDFLEDSSTMIFEVEVDGKLVYDNGNGTKTKDQMAPVSLDVTGKSAILLYVRDGFDDSAGDFGVWGGARLVK